MLCLRKNDFLVLGCIVSNIFCLESERYSIQRVMAGSSQAVQTGNGWCALIGVLLNRPFRRVLGTAAIRLRGGCPLAESELAAQSNAR